MYNRYTVHITKKCNFNCDYCYINNRNEGNILLEDILHNIDIIMQEAINNKQEYIELEFLGGEPFLEIDIIDFCCKHIAKFYNKVKIKYLITTNMSIISEKIVNILVKYNFYVGISIDGTSFAHNTCRHFLNGKGTYDIIMKNALTLKKNISDKNICIQLTLHEFNIGYLYESIESIYNLGFNKINLGVVNKDINNEFLSEYEKQCIKVIDDLYKFKNLYIVSIMDNVKYNVEYEYDKNKSITVEKFKIDDTSVTDIDILNKKLYKYFSIKRVD